MIFNLFMALCYVTGLYLVCYEFPKTLKETFEEGFKK